MRDVPHALARDKREEFRRHLNKFSAERLACGYPSPVSSRNSVVSAPSGNSSVGVNSGIQALPRAVGPDVLW